MEAIQKPNPDFYDTINDLDAFLGNTRGAVRALRMIAEETHMPSDPRDAEAFWASLTAAERFIEDAMGGVTVLFAQVVGGEA